ncbi:MAG: sensor domain-containing diguanylate cyclase, partial [Turicibacter sp.]
KKYDSAEDMFLKAVKEAEEIKTPILLKETYQELSELYSKLEKYKEAYEAIKRSLEYEKEIFNSNSGIWFAKLHSVQITQEASAYKILYDQMNLMSKIGQRITSNLERDVTLQTIYQEVNTLVKADVFGIAIYKEEINCLDYEFFAFKGEQVDGGKAPIEGSPSFGAYSFNHKTEILINDISQEYQKYLNVTLPIDDDNPNKPNSLIFCPLIIEDRTIGIISVQQFNKHAYTKNDLNILRMLTSYIAIALENTKLFHEVEYLATYDSLSGALNRREVLKLGQTYFEQNIDNEDEMSIIMLDIDYFKNINDTYGHFVGDDVIKQVSTLIQSNVREYDFVGRYGGEEFLIVLLKTDLQCAKAVAERIRKAVEEKNYSATNQINVTVSSGIYQITYEELNFFEGVKLADIALYKAKQLGRNKVVKYISDLSLSINK